MMRLLGAPAGLGHAKRDLDDAMGAATAYAAAFEILIKEQFLSHRCKEKDAREVSFSAAASSACCWSDTAIQVYVHELVDTCTWLDETTR